MNSTGSFQVQDRQRAQAVAAFVPFFVDSAIGDENSARLAAQALLDDYKAATPRELQLSTQIIAFGWAAMSCLRAAVAARNLPLDQMLKLQDDAIALDRSSQKATKTLEARRKDRTNNPKSLTLENTKWDEGAFQLAINQALDKLNEANSKLAVYIATQVPEMARPKLAILSAEQMTKSLLARRARK